MVQVSTPHVTSCAEGDIVVCDDDAIKLNGGPGLQCDTVCAESDV